MPFSEKKHIACVFFLFFVCLFSAIGFLKYVSSQSIFDHSAFDQYSRQAKSWLQGKMSVENSTFLEMVEVSGKHYVSFPPVPSLFEIPLALGPWESVPNQLPPMILLSIAACFMFVSLWNTHYSKFFAAFLSLAFIFASNLVISLGVGGVWHFAQIEGFSFATLAILLLSKKNPSTRSTVLGFIMLGLAIGCRPHYIFYAVLCLVLCQEAPHRLSTKQIAMCMIVGMFPFLVAYMSYNFLRFGNPLEFGHSNLPYAKGLRNGLYSGHYFLQNCYNVFFKLPEFILKKDGISLAFDYRGTAFWFNNLFLFLASVIIVKNCWFRSEKIWRSLAITGGAIWIFLLTNESNGWTQMGYRYGIDLLPLAWCALLFTAREQSHVSSSSFFQSRMYIYAGIYGIGINLIGYLWFLGL